MFSTIWDSLEQLWNSEKICEGSEEWDLPNDQLKIRDGYIMTNVQENVDQWKAIIQYVIKFNKFVRKNDTSIL